MKNTCMSFSFLLLGSMLGMAQSFSIEHLYPIELSHSFLQFETTYMGYAKVKGNFENFYGSIYYDPDYPESTSVSFQIDVNSMDTNNSWRDKDLKSGNWFLVDSFPHIRFISTQVVQKETGLYVTGDLTIKDNTQRISFPLEVPFGVILDIRGDDQVIFTGSYTLNRKEYGVMGKNWDQVKEGIAALSNDVTIEFSLLGKQINEGNFTNFLRNPESPHGSVYASYQVDGLDGALNQYAKLKADGKGDMRILNMVAYMLMKQRHFEDAQALLEKNLSEYPDEANVYDSLGELHLYLGNEEKAKSLYQKSLEIDPTNLNAEEVLKHL